MSRLQWVICAVAALGFAFDSYELLMLPLIVQPALAELLHVAPNSPEVNTWVGMPVPEIWVTCPNAPYCVVTAFCPAGCADVRNGPV